MDYRRDLGKVLHKGHELAMHLLTTELPHRSAQSSYARDLEDPELAATIKSTSRTHDVLSHTNRSCCFYGFADRFEQTHLWVPECPARIRGRNGQEEANCTLWFFRALRVWEEIVLLNHLG
jgi:hypothetical protein